MFLFLVELGSVGSFLKVLLDLVLGMCLLKYFPEFLCRIQRLGLVTFFPNPIILLGNGNILGDHFAKELLLAHLFWPPCLEVVNTH